MGGRFPLAPRVGGLAPCAKQYFRVALRTQRRFDFRMVVQKEMTWHQNHWHGVHRPDAAVRIHLDRHFGFHVFHTSPSSRTQFSPITFLMRGSDQPRFAIAAVRLGNSPMVRMPRGLTTSPNSVSL